MKKIGTISDLYFDLENYIHGFEKVRSHGYDCVDLGLANPGFPIYSLTESQFEKRLVEIGKCAKQNGLEIFQAHGLWTADMLANTEERRLEHVEYYKKQLRGASYLDCKNLVIHPIMPFSWWGEEKDHDGIVDMQMEELSAILPTAEEFGVTVCLENMPLGISKVPFIKELVTLANSKYVKACLDTGHANMQKEDIYESVILLGDDLRVLHVHDNSGSGDEHKAPYQGTVNWEGFTKGLHEIGYDGCLSMEASVKSDQSVDSYEKSLVELAKIARDIADKV